jgi:hypothetical protein
LQREQHSEAALRRYQVDQGCSRTEGAPDGVQLPPSHVPFSRFAVAAGYRRFKLADGRHDDEQCVGPVRQYDYSTERPEQIAGRPLGDARTAYRHSRREDERK